MKNFFDFAMSEAGFMIVFICSIIFLTGSGAVLSYYMELNSYNHYLDRVIECRAELSKQQQRSLHDIEQHCGPIIQRKDF